MTEQDDMKPEVGDTVEEKDSGDQGEVVAVYKSSVRVKFSTGTETLNNGKVFVVRRAS